MNAADHRWHSPAAERNQPAILAVLKAWLPARGLALEIASGSGQHASHFAAGLPGWVWQPTDPDPGALASIAVWAAEVGAGAGEVRSPLRLDVLNEPWALTLGAAPDLVFCANMIHIAPEATCAALMRGSAACLAPAGRLVMYGPFLGSATPDAPRNLAFDADLRARHPDWGVRALADVLAEAGRAGLHLAKRQDMPANNLMLAFERG